MPWFHTEVKLGLAISQRTQIHSVITKCWGADEASERRKGGAQNYWTRSAVQFAL